MFMHPRCDICRGFGERGSNELFGFDLEDKVHRKKKSFTSHLAYMAHFQGTAEKDITLTRS